MGTVVGDTWQSQEMVSEVPWLTVEIPRPAFEDSYLVCVAADEVTLAPCRALVLQYPWIGSPPLKSQTSRVPTKQRGALYLSASLLVCS